MRVLLIAGGWSPEREVSLSGAKTIAQALQEKQHRVTWFDPLTEFDCLAAKAVEHDFAFLALHGAPGEDGLIQAILDQVGCPYQGSGAAGSFLALHKAAAKQLFRQVGLNTPNWAFLPVLPEADWEPSFDYPVFVKSNTGGSSLGMGRARNTEELHKLLAELFAQGEEVLVEPLVPGQEVTCGVLHFPGAAEAQALPPILIRPTGEFFDYTSKYQKGAAEELCPAPLPEKVLANIQAMALKAHKSLGLQDYSRSDFILDAHNTLHLLEVNTLPGMTATSLVPQEAAVLGYDFAALIQLLMDSALANKKMQKYE